MLHTDIEPPKVPFATVSASVPGLNGLGEAMDLGEGDLGADGVGVKSLGR